MAYKNLYFYLCCFFLGLFSALGTPLLVYFSLFCFPRMNRLQCKLGLPLHWLKILEKLSLVTLFIIGTAYTTQLARSYFVSLALLSLYFFSHDLPINLLTHAQNETQ